MGTLSVDFNSVTSSVKSLSTEPKSSEGQEKEAGVTTPTSLSFPIEVFPLEIQEIISSYLQSEGFNHDFLCASMFTVFASAMGNLWEAKFTSTMRVSPILYMVLIGPPSSGKTPPLRQAVIPLQRYDKENDDVYNPQKKEYDRLMQMTSKERKEQGFEEYPEKPVHKEILVIDFTIEKLFSIIKDNPHGNLVLVNELNRLVSNLNRYGKGSDEGYWIEFFDGNQVKYERKGSGEYINVFRPYVSVIGGMQPGLLSRMFGGARMASGFTTRFLKIFPDITEMPKWKQADEMSENVTLRWENIIRRVLKKETECEYDSNGEIVPKVLKFSQDAIKILSPWEEKIEQEWENADSYIQGVCGKLKTYVIRFCLIIHVMRIICEEVTDEMIDEKSAKAACTLADYFLEMDKRVHNLVSNKPVDTVHQQLYDMLEDEFSTADAVSVGTSLKLSERTVKRFLSNGIGNYLKKDRHGIYTKFD